MDGAPDWRGLLDLLEEHGSGSFDDLWRTWVARPTDLPLLDARQAARAPLRRGGRRGRGLAAAATDPRRDAGVAVRHGHGAARRRRRRCSTNAAAIEAAATAAGLTPPDTLHVAFERPDGFASATDEAAAELASIDRYDAAAATRPAAPDLLQALGLWGATPDADLGRPGRCSRRATWPGRRPRRTRPPRPGRAPRTSGGAGW